MTYSLKNDQWIVEQSKKGMIQPFEAESVSENNDLKVISYGTTSFGYDIRLGTQFKLFNVIEQKKHYAGNNKVVVEQPQTIIDPKHFNKYLIKDLTTIKDKATGEEYVLLPPYSFTLGTSLEYVQIPDNVYALLTCKSSLARVGLNINCTGLQPSFKGNITIEFTNPTPFSVKLYCREGVGNLIFFEGNKPNEVYNGKYQNQEGVTIVR